MERRRRARINQSLTELKALVLDGMKKDVSRLIHSPSLVVCDRLLWPRLSLAGENIDCG